MVNLNQNQINLLWYLVYMHHLKYSLFEVKVTKSVDLVLALKVLGLGLTRFVVQTGVRLDFRHLRKSQNMYDSWYRGEMRPLTDVPESAKLFISQIDFL